MEKKQSEKQLVTEAVRCTLLSKNWGKIFVYVDVAWNENAQVNYKYLKINDNIRVNVFS